MPTPPSKKHDLGFPIFAVAFGPKKPRLIVGGGGGATRAGIKNSLIIYDLDEHTLDLKELAEHQFDKQDDGCMSIGVNSREKILAAAVNSPEADVKAGKNQNLRVLLLKGDKLYSHKTLKTIDRLDTSAYQKVTRFSPNGKLLLTGTTEGKLNVWTYPELKEAMPAYDHEDDIVDADFDPAGQLIVSVSNKKLFVRNAMTGATIFSREDPELEKNRKAEFRAARFGVRESEGHLFVVTNIRSTPKKCYVSKWAVGKEERDWDRKKFRLVANACVTAFNISDDGKLLAIGAADMSVSILGSGSLNSLLRVNNVHGFPVTSLAFSPGGHSLVTGSADACVTVIRVPQTKGSGWSWFTWLIVLALLVALVWYLLQLGEEQDL
ncbi:hypothetical protein HK097_011036 [Rhizophlyctis rosea]|uniref:Prolactin regulatory element-binding protein n=1 Tax=Rhizophlyctis rosea TaxID=64517 RepID=A0AAD5SES5_9FUNG|nr:hypothetical protein HK097_011036 [Rhizophlyctis rosea]